MMIVGWRVNVFACGLMTVRRRGRVMDSASFFAASGPWVGDLNPLLQTSGCLTSSLRGLPLRPFPASLDGCTYSAGRHNRDSFSIFVDFDIPDAGPSALLLVHACCTAGLFAGISWGRNALLRTAAFHLISGCGFVADELGLICDLLGSVLSAFLSVLAFCSRFLHLAYGG